VVWPVHLTAPIMVCKPLDLFSINAIDVLTHSFKGFLIASVAETLVRLFDNIIDVLIKSDLTKR
jgi:hypothetical protein